MIDLDDSIKDLVPLALASLPKGIYKLTKTETSRPYSQVFVGESMIGPLSIVSVAGKPGILVRCERTGYKYIRTSPVVEVLDATNNTLTFRTEGGVYKLERIE